DGPLAGADVAVAGQVAQEGGQFLVNDLGDPDRVAPVLGQTPTIQLYFIPGDQVGQLRAVPAAHPAPVADDRLDINPGLGGDGRQGEPGFGPPVDAHGLGGPQVGAGGQVNPVTRSD